MIMLMEVLSVFSAIVAAIFWFWSAQRNAPPPSSAWGGMMDENDPFFQELARSARFGRYAAVSAGISAALGIAAIVSSL